MKLTYKQRNALHSLNMAARKECHTSDIHEWYYWLSVVGDLLTQKQLSRYFFLAHKKGVKKEQHKLKKWFDENPNLNL